MSAVVHPHIAISQKVCGGSPRIKGTRITVRTIVIYTLFHGQTPEELLTHYPHIRLASIYDALSYYYDNREAINKEIAEHLAPRRALSRKEAGIMSNKTQVERLAQQVIQSTTKAMRAIDKTVLLVAASERRIERLTRSIKKKPTRRRSKTI